MAKYRPIDIRIWNDRKFLSLSDDGRILWMFLLTAPTTLPVPGVIIGGEATIAEYLSWTPERVRKVFGELFAKQLSVRVEGRLVWLPNALKYQTPRNQNMVKGWSETWDDIPECTLKLEIWQALKIACKSWSSLFTRLFREPTTQLFAKQTGKQICQDQDQDQDQKQDLKNSATPLAGGPQPGFSAFEDRIQENLGDIGLARARGGRRKPRPSEPSDSERASVRVVLDKLGAQNGVTYSGTSEHTRLIVNQLRNGVTELEMRAVIGYCAMELGWKGDERMEKFLRPDTLFGPKTIARYLDPARAWFAKLPVDDAPARGAEDEPEWMRGGDA